MVNTEIGLIIFFAAKHGEALYSQQKQDQELTVVQIMSSLLPNSLAYTLVLSLLLDNQRHFTKEDLQMANKYSLNLGIRSS